MSHRPPAPRRARAAALAVALAVLAPLLVGTAAHAAEATSLRFSSTNPAAGARADFTFAIGVAREADTARKIRAARLDFPAGALANPRDRPTCSTADFARTFGSGPNARSGCPAASQVGDTAADVVGAGLLPLTAPGELFLLPPQGREAARLGIFIHPPLGDPIRSLAPVTVSDTGDFHLQTIIGPLPTQADNALFGADVPIEITQIRGTLYGSTGARVGGRAPAGGLPFWTNPTRCAAATGSVAASAAVDGTGFTGTRTSAFTPTGCASTPFTPAVRFTATDPRPRAVTGMTVDVTQPEGAAGQAQSSIASATVRLPTGLDLNARIQPPVASCTAAAFAQGSRSPAGCPPLSRIGVARLVSPPVGTLTGPVYLSFAGGDIRVFIEAVDARDVARVKLVGALAKDGRTQQLVTQLDGLPQVPVTQFRLDFDGGAHSAFVWSNDQGCQREGSAAFSGFSGAARRSVADVGLRSCPAGTVPPASGAGGVERPRVDATLRGFRSSRRTLDLRIRPDDRRPVSRTTIRLPKEVRVDRRRRSGVRIDRLVRRTVRGTRRSVWRRLGTSRLRVSRRGTVTLDGAVRGRSPRTRALQQQVRVRIARRSLRVRPRTARALARGRTPRLTVRSTLTEFDGARVVRQRSLGYVRRR